jgi:hypothetical protein
MSEPVIYTLKIGLAKLVITLTDDRFTSKGAMANSDFPLADLQYFCMVPTETAYGYDSQLIVSWLEKDKLKNKKLNVRQADQSFQEFLAAFTARFPDASLVNLEAGEALKKMGVSSLANTANKMEAFGNKARKWTLIGAAIFFALLFIGIGIAWIASKF